MCLVKNTAAFLMHDTEKIGWLRGSQALHQRNEAAKYSERELDQMSQVALWQASIIYTIAKMFT